MLGYNKNLYILPFDHRSSFEKNLFGKSELNQEEKEYVKKQKQVIFKAFKRAIEQQVPKEESAILVDEQYGEEIISQAKAEGINFLLTTEKSGQEEFSFEYRDFENHIEKFNPTFVKALVRFHKDTEINKRQEEKLLRLSNYCKAKNLKFLLELLIPKDEDSSSFKFELRPQICKKAIIEFQEAGIEPDVWKLEGTNKIGLYQELVDAAKRDNRENVGVVVLGGGERSEEVDLLIKTAAAVEGIIGFAVGRTIFWQSIEELHRNQISEEDAITNISNNFIHYYNLFISNKK